MHEAPESDFDALALYLCDGLESHLPERYVLFGHSMGALLAYRISLHLRARRRPLPVALLISACAAPSQQHPKCHEDKDSESLIADLREWNGTPEEVFQNAELLSMALSLLRADNRICASFRHGQLPPLPLHIRVFAGKFDEIREEQLEAWRQENTAEFSLDWFNGGHFFLRQHEEAFLSILVKYLAQDLARLS